MQKRLLWFAKRNRPHQWHQERLLQGLTGSGISTLHSGNTLLQPQKEPETKEAILANMRVLTLVFFIRHLHVTLIVSEKESLSDRIQVKSTEHRLTPVGICAFLHGNEGPEKHLK